MWSLYRKKEDENNIFDYKLEKLEPLKFSNGKTQEDVVNEILEKIKNGTKIIFIRGMCGSGKSAIALNLAKHFKKTAIVVPSKSLQDQYERDYGKNKMVILKDEDTPLKISVIKGRSNFFCKFSGEKADHYDLPCTIEIKEKNLQKIFKYIEQNRELKNKEYFQEIEDIRRIHIAPACPYWAMITKAKANPNFNYTTKKKYMSIAGEEYAIFRKKKGCEYYDQYDAYADSDVIVFNAQKYLIETAIGRKPKTDLDIIDECDEFLDNFAGEKSINLQRLANSLTKLSPPTKPKKQALKEMIQEIRKIQRAPEEIQKVKESPFNKLFELILNNQDLAEDEELNYYNTVVENILSFKDVINDTYVTIRKISRDKNQKKLFQEEDETTIVTLASINLSQKIKELLEINNIMIFMSGTLHSEEVLREIFNIENFEIIDAETKTIGEIKKTYTGLERNCSYASFKAGTVTRSSYLKILDMCLANAKPPTLIQISAFRDLPTEEEKRKNFLEHTSTQEQIKTEQEFWQKPIEEFYNGQREKLFTTKCTRGIDFPGEKCNSIVITRFPYPNIDSLFWKVFKKEHPDKFMKFYMDKGRRELYQRIARAVRFRGDSVEILSPDSRVLRENFE